MNPHSQHPYMSTLRATEREQRSIRLHRFIGMAGFVLLIAVVVAALFSGAK